MPSCERCWSMSHMAWDPEDEYRRLVLVNDCTPEQQAGPGATVCPKCETTTVHQYAKVCIACGYVAKEAIPDA